MGCVLLISAGWVACAAPEPGTGGPFDLAGARDLRRDAGAPDLTARDLAGVTFDLSGETPDLTVPDNPDLTSPNNPDLTGMKLDLAVVDLAKPPDLAVPPDLTAPRDFAVPPDLATPPDLVVACVAQTQPCDVMCQNCGTNLKCGASQGKPVCQADGTVGTGLPCGAGGVDDCSKGNVCVSATKNYGICRLFCRTDADCKNGGKCAWTLTGGTLKVCSEPVTGCDFAANTGCAAGSGCYVVTPTGQTGCHAAGTGGQDASCVSDYECRGGYACFGGLCLRGCKSSNACPFFYSCYTVNGWPSTYGVCDL